VVDRDPGAVNHNLVVVDHNLVVVEREVLVVRREVVVVERGPGKKERAGLNEPAGSTSVVLQPTSRL